jgi:hypothetical protein
VSAHARAAVLLRRTKWPNGCGDACVGGSNDAPCGSDSECPGGFCHNADCRLIRATPIRVRGDAALRVQRSVGARRALRAMRQRRGLRSCPVFHVCAG